jgi:hypothetical protein
MAIMTTDGGAIWRALPTPAAVSSLCFANRRVGWAVVAGKGTVLRTTDGGRSWRRILPHGASGATFFINGGAISCVSASTAWVLLYGGAGMAQQTYGLYRTGGRTWRAVAVSPARSKDAPEGLLDAAAFVDRRHGYAQTMAVPPRYVGTSDGGAHWRPVLGVTGPAACGARLAGYPVVAALQQAQHAFPPTFRWETLGGVTGPRQGWDLVSHCERTRSGRYLGPYLLTSADAGRTWREFRWDNAFWCIPQGLSFATAVDGWLLMQGDSHLYPTTNHRERLDPAIIDRPSRFDRKYPFDLPAARSAGSTPRSGTRPYSRRCACPRPRRRRSPSRQKGFRSPT